MLSKRLMTIYEMLPKVNRLIDVGCDHALLGIYALKKEQVKKVLAIDINDKRLKTAVDNIKKYRVKDIMLAKNDGLNNIKINLSDVVVISGLGAKTITKIVRMAEPINHLIIQSNKDLFYLRYHIIKLGYHIYKEEVVLDKNLYYVVIYFKKGLKIYSLTDLLIGPFVKKSNKDYLNHLIKKHELINKNIPSLYFIHKFKNNLKIYLLKKAYKKHFFK